MDADKFERVEITSEPGLWEWLERNHTRPDSLWLVTWKAQHRDLYLSREVVLDALIAYGWIDGRRMKLDEGRVIQLISPRKQQAWAQSYKTRAAKLEAEGRMRPAGRAALLAGMESGKWTQSDPVDALIDPEDLVEALEACSAEAWWRAAAPSYRRNILRWIAGAKQPQTRLKRIAVAAAAAAKGEKVPQY